MGQPVDEPAASPPSPREPRAPQARLRLHGDSFSYACPSILSRSQRVAASIVVALGDGPLGIDTRAASYTGAGFIVAPQCDRVLKAPDTPIFLVDIEPIHPRYRAFAAATADAPVIALPPSCLPQLRALGRDFLTGALGGEVYDRELRRQVHRLAEVLGPQPPLDPRVIDVMRAVHAQPSLHLTDLARSVHLSAGHLCRLFSSSLGITLRQYAISVKTRNAARLLGEGRSLTEVALLAGFSDSAHFAKVWARCYGRPPQHTFRPTDLQIDPDALPPWARGVPEGRF